jgi:hypothetical protein
MKDLSGYIESILCGRLPNSRVDVYLVDQRYIISMDVYEVRKERTGDDFLKLMITEVIDSELKTYFPTEVPNNKKIINAYEGKYGEGR